MTALLDRARGDWTPATSAPILLALQLLLLWQVGLRGLDYVHPTGRPALDVSIASPLLGWLLYGAAVLVLLGLAIRRAAPVILGEALVAAWYLGMGWVSLVDLGLNPGPVAAVAAAGSAAGVWLLVIPRHSTIARLCGVAAMLAGQAALAAALGDDYRTSTGFLAAGLVHGALAVGTFVLWQRTRLSAYLDRIPDDEVQPWRTF